MQTRRKQITQCRATTLCKKKVLEHGCFCVDHELIWIAKCGEPSIRIRTKHKKMYERFQRQCEREFDALEDYRLQQMLAAQQRNLNTQVDRIYKEISKHVHDAALYGFGEHAPAPADRNLGFDLDDGAEGRAPRGDWRLSTSAYEPAGEGQSEVPAPDVHRSGK